MCTDVPTATAHGAIWSGLRGDKEAIIRAFTEDAAPAKFTLTAWDGTAPLTLTPPAALLPRVFRDGEKVRVVKEK